MNQEPSLHHNHLGMTFCLGYTCSIFSKSITSIRNPAKGFESYFLLADFLAGHHLPTFLDFCMWLVLQFSTTMLTLSIRFALDPLGSTA